MLPGRIRIAPTVAVVLLLVTPSAAASGVDGPSFQVGALSGYTVQSSGRREVTFLISLALPLDRVARPRQLGKPVLAEESAKHRPDPQRPAAAEAGAASAEVPGWKPLRARLTPRLARATVAAALVAAGSSGAAAHFAALASRSRSSALLPELRLRAERSTDEALRLAPTAADPYRYTRSGGTTLTLEARATWRLDRLVFAEEEIGVARLRRARARSDQRLVREVLDLLAAWQRALWVLTQPDLPDERKLAAELERVEAEVRLDVLTAGRFSALAGLGGEKRLARAAALE